MFGMKGTIVSPLSGTFTLLESIPTIQVLVTMHIKRTYNFPFVFDATKNERCSFLYSLFLTGYVSVSLLWLLKKTVYIYKDHIYLLLIKNYLLCQDSNLRI